MNSIYDVRILLPISVYRFFNCLLVQTWFEPDEYWQSLEPAHFLAFGYGHLTWEWRQGLRSYLYPLLIASIYKTLQFFSYDYRWLLVFTPSLLQSALSVVADAHYFAVLRILFDDYTASLAFLAYYANWFQFFCAPRTLMNTVETQLLLVGLFYYQWPEKAVTNFAQLRYQPSIKMCTTIATVSTLLRPTSAVVWICLFGWLLLRIDRKIRLLVEAATFALSVLTLVTMIDCYFYGRFVFTLWNFFEFNFLTSGSAQFGEHSWHWYISNGLPSVLLIHAIFIVLGIYTCWRQVKWPLVLTAVYVFFHSLVPHKELRFLLPVLPLLNIYVGLYLSKWSPLPAALRGRLGSPGSLARWAKLAPARVRSSLALLVVCNLPVVLYTCLLHQRGVLDVTAYLHDVATEPSLRNRLHVWFLMPCHSTPLHSHLHSANLESRLLTCEPELREAGVSYADESHRFYSHPAQWLQTEFANDNVVRPDLVVMFEVLHNQTRPFWTETQYKKCSTFFNTHFPISSRQSERLVVLCKR